jgi:hypothetical protein
VLAESRGVAVVLRKVVVGAEWRAVAAVLPKVVVGVEWKAAAAVLPRAVGKVAVEALLWDAVVHLADSVAAVGGAVVGAPTVAMERGRDALDLPLGLRRIREIG